MIAPFYMNRRLQIVSFITQNTRPKFEKAEKWEQSEYISYKKTSDFSMYFHNMSLFLL